MRVTLCRAAILCAFLAALAVGWTATTPMARSAEKEVPEADAGEAADQARMLAEMSAYFKERLETRQRAAAEEGEARLAAEATLLKSRPRSVTRLQPQVYPTPTKKGPWDYTPIIDEYTPRTAEPGTSIRITGRQFGAGMSVSFVLGNGVSRSIAGEDVQFDPEHPETITAKIPSQVVGLLDNDRALVFLSRRSPVAAWGSFLHSARKPFRFTAHRVTAVLDLKKTLAYKVRNWTFDASGGGDLGPAFYDGDRQEINWWTEAGWDNSYGAFPRPDVGNAILCQHQSQNFTGFRGDDAFTTVEPYLQNGWLVDGVEFWQSSRPWKPLGDAPAPPAPPAGGPPRPSFPGRALPGQGYAENPEEFGNVRLGVPYLDAKVHFVCEANGGVFYGMQVVIKGPAGVDPYVALQSRDAGTGKDVPAEDEEAVTEKSAPK